MASSLNLRTRARVCKRSIDRALDVLAGGCDSPVRSGWGAGLPMFVQARPAAPTPTTKPGAATSTTSWPTGRCSSATRIRRWYEGSTRSPRRLRLGHDASARDSSRRTHSRAPAFDGAHALRHDRHRGDDERDSRRARLYRTRSRAQVCRQLPRALRPRADRRRRVGRQRQRRQRNSARRAPTTCSSRDTTTSTRWTNSSSRRATSSRRSSSSRSRRTWASCIPVEGFSKACGARAGDCGALLIFDEVITWLRFGLRGAQGRTASCPT